MRCRLAPLFGDFVPSNSLAFLGERLLSSRIVRLMRTLALCACAVAFAWASSARASPEDIFGWGPRSPAMGGTGVATATGVDATYTNPALLSLIHENKLTLGFAGATFDLHADGPQLPGRVSALPAQGYVVGVAVPIPFGGILRDRIATGFAFYTPTDALVRGRILYPETPDFPLLADRTQSIAVRIGAGADIGYGIRVGAGVAALANLVGSIDVVSTGGIIGSKVDDQLIATYAPAVGLAWDLPFDLGRDGRPRWRIGASYRGSIGATFGVNVDASKLSTLNLPVFNIAGVAQYDPDEFAFEVAHVRDGWTVAAGVTWKHWSAYPGVFEPTVLCPAGSDCAALTPPPIGFSNTIVPRLGAEKHWALPQQAAIRLRAGFFYEPTPVPGTLVSSQAYDLGSQGLINVPTRFFDTSRYVLSVGGGVDLGTHAPFTVDFWAQYHVLASTTVQTCTQTVPCSPDIGTGPAKLSGNVLAYGAMVGVRF
jgi:long-subunit fatty acid transport protein